MDVAFLGLGAMGAPMAARVCARFRTRVWNRTPEKARALAERGAEIATSPRACVEGADVAVAMLADGAALGAVLAGPDGALAGLRAGAVLVDMSTSGRRAALEAAAAVSSAGAAFVDAPVSGTVGPAERGELVAFAGGAPHDVERVRPVLEAMCRRILHAGGVGQGQALKVALNGLGAHHLVGFVSMLALAERAGIARDVAVEAFTQGAFATPSYLGKKAKVLARDFSPEFTLGLTQKDVSLAIDLEREVGLELPALRAVRDAVARGVAEGLGALDLFALERIYGDR